MSASKSEAHSNDLSMWASQSTSKAFHTSETFQQENTNYHDDP